jgi:ribokinase
MSSIEIIGLGAMNIDHIYQVERILDDGEAVVEGGGLFPGGSAANTIYGLAKLGIKTGFAGVVGDDADGRLLIQDFRSVGVDISQIRIKKEAKTGSTLCLSDSSGRRSIYVIPAANNLLNEEDINLTYIEQASLLHISSFADNRQLQILLDLTSELTPSVKVSFSPGELYAAKGLKSLVPILSKTNILFTNEVEIEILTGKDFIAGAEVCLEQGCQIVVVTLGKGKVLNSHKRTNAICYIRDTNNEYLVEPIVISKTPAVDTTGAGDAFATGFLYGLLKRRSLEECGQLGDIMARFSIRETGARAGLPTLTELAEHYRGLYKERL